jgi:integrase
MVLLFNLGLRRRELINIKMIDMFPDRGHVVLRVKGKGDKTRILPLSDYVLLEIRNYLNVLEKLQVYLDADDYLLQTSGNSASKNKIPVDGSTIYRTINKYAKNLGINKRVSPHSCRATVISHLLDTQHQAIRDVATFAGHSNITTTERYDKRRLNLDKSAAYEVNYLAGVREG